MQLPGSSNATVQQSKEGNLNAKKRITVCRGHG